MSMTRKPLVGLIAIGAALVMPMAVAQTAAPTASAQAGATPSDTATSPAATAPAAPPKQVTWADLDTDKDGNLSKPEVATVPALSQVFDQADADKNGKLTADEYKTFAAANAGGGNAGQGG
ncbi:MAG: EF-hand domain-containing protein [Luteimonas sp.]